MIDDNLLYDDNQNNTNVGSTAGDGTVASSVIYNSNPDSVYEEILDNDGYEEIPDNDGYEEIPHNDGYEEVPNDNEIAQRHSDIFNDNEEYADINETAANNTDICDVITSNVKQKNTYKATLRCCGLLQMTSSSVPSSLWLCIYVNTNFIVLRIVIV